MYIENDPIDLQGGLNRYTYVNGNPLHNIDPTGEFATPIPFAVGVGGALVACYATGACQNLSKAIENAMPILSKSIEELLNPPTPIVGDNAPTIPKPKKQNGKHVCYCRIQGSNCEGERAYGFGIGVGKTRQEAKSMAEKSAKSNIPEGYSNIHHVSCKCIDPKGQVSHQGG